jgi:hypothetical protein
MRSMAAKKVGKKLVCASVVVSRPRPAITVSMPAIITRNAPNRSTIRAVTPSDRTPTVTVQGRKARPVCSAP